MIENIEELAKFVKGGAEVLQNALKTDEKVSLEFKEGSFVSENELSDLKTTIRNDQKRESEKVGYDFAMKDLKKDFNLELEGKDRSKIVEAIKGNILAEANIEPNKKVSELTQSLDNLRSQYDNDLTAKDNEIQKLSGQLQGLSIDSQLSKKLPDQLNGIDHNDFLTLAKTNASFEYEDGNLVVKKGGEILKDKMEKPIDPSAYLNDFANSKGWLSTEGRGGSDQQSGNGSFNSMHDVYRHMETNNIDPTSLEGQKLINDFNS